jgi:hypothetical protein
MWRNRFSQLFNIHGVSDVKQTEIHTAEALVPEPSAFEVEMAVEKLKSHKSPGIYQIPIEMIKAGGRTIHSEIYKLINSIWNKDELPEVWKESFTVPVHKKGDKTDCNNCTGILVLSTTYKILSYIQLSRLTQYAEASACKTNTTQNQPHQISKTQRTENKTTNVVIQQHSHRLLKMDILTSETC